MGFKEQLEDIYDLELKTDEPMKKHTTLGCGGRAKWYTEIRSLYSLNRAVLAAKRCRVPVKIIGGGSNVLVSDKGFNGLIISTVRLKDVFMRREGITAMCGAQLSALCAFAAKSGLSGLEWAAGIPGTAGGAAVQNAGAFGHSAADVILWVETLKNGKLVRYYNKDCKFGYRTSRFKKTGETVVSATFALNPGNKSEIALKTEQTLSARKEAQPAGKNCGSVFLNPEGDYAARLIEQAGLKGSCIGGAAVSEKHANFITASSSAQAEDVYMLIQYIKKKVKDKFGVLLTEEVEFIGEF